MLVFWNHFELYSFGAGIVNHWDVAAVSQIGKTGVLLFFVISGFLITHLLFEEERMFGSIDVRKFYIRRMLRIWPLYFLIIVLGFLLIPSIIALFDPTATDVLYDHFWLKLALLLLILPNLSDSIFGHGFLPSFNQVWSIGVEEQFYLFWPLLFKRFKKNRLYPLLLFSGLYLTVKVLINFLPDSTYKLILKHFMYLFPIDCIALGAGVAVLFHMRKESVLRLLFSKTTQWTVLLMTMVLMVSGIYIKYFHFEVYSILFAILVLNFALNKECIFSLEHPALDYIGKMSYGFYMLHCIILKALIILLGHFNMLSRYTLLFSAFTVTLLLATISYRFFESRFLRKKIHYSRIITGDSAG